MKTFLWIFLTLFVLINISYAADVFPPKKRVGHVTQPSTYYGPAVGEFLQNWNDPDYVYAFNSSGGSLTAGYLVVWDDAMTKLDSAVRVSACDTLALSGADTATTYRWRDLRFKGLNAMSACSLDIAGLDTVGSSQTESGLVLNGSAGVVVYSNKLWRKVSQIIWRNGAANDSLVTYTLPYMGVTTTTTADNINVAGVVATTASADSLTKIQIRGITEMYLKGTSVEIQPGMTIQSSTTAGYGAADATEVTSAGAGKAMVSGNEDSLYWVQLDLQ